MIADAIDTVFTLGWALLAWIVLTAAAATLALYAVVAVVWAPVHAARKALGAAFAASGAVRALGEQPERYRPIQRPSWAHLTPDPDLPFPALIASRRRPNPSRAVPSDIGTPERQP